jgi:hypothetical protein
MKSSQISDVILLTLFGLAGSILVGFIFYNNQIFISNKSVFQFVVYGFFGSLFFSLLKYRPRKDQIFGIVIMFLVNFVIIGKSFSLAWVIRDVLYMGSLFIAIIIYFRFIRRNFNLPYYVRSFALALFYSVLTILFGILLFIINAKFEFPPINFLFAIGKTSMLIGFGIGLGLDFYLQNKSHIVKFLGFKTA